MSDSSKSAGKNTEVSRAVRLALAAALLGAAARCGRAGTFVERGRRRG